MDAVCHRRAPHWATCLYGWHIVGQYLWSSSTVAHFIQSHCDVLNFWLTMLQNINRLYYLHATWLWQANVHSQNTSHSLCSVSVLMRPHHQHCRWRWLYVQVRGEVIVYYYTETKTQNYCLCMAKCSCDVFISIPFAPNKSNHPSRHRSSFFLLLCLWHPTNHISPEREFSTLFFFNLTVRSDYVL